MRETETAGDGEPTDARTRIGMDDLLVRSVVADDYDRWKPLWDGYNAFYGRSGETALPDPVTRTTWARFLDDAEPMHALVAVHGDELVGTAHYLFHRSTIDVHPVCYLQDLFTDPAARGAGIGRALIEAVAARAAEAGSGQLYWRTHESNATARRLYDQMAANTGFLVYRTWL